MMTATEIVAFLKRLRNIRHFKPDPVPEPIIRDLLEVARWSGSSVNRQPWEFIVVRDRAMLDRLAVAGPYVRHLASAPLGIVLVMAGEHFEDETFDEGRVCERIMLAAAAHGLGASIGWFTDDAVQTAKTLLGIPAEKLVRSVLSIGYPTETAKQYRLKPGQARKPLDQLVSWERYGQRSSGESITTGRTSA